MPARHGSCSLPAVCQRPIMDATSVQRADLQAAFRAFGSVSEQLSGAFDSLRGQVLQLQHDLTEAHAGNEHLAARMSGAGQGIARRGARARCAGHYFRVQSPPPLNCWTNRCWARRCRRCLKRSVPSSGSSSEHIELRSGRFRQPVAPANLCRGRRGGVADRCHRVAPDAGLHGAAAAAVDHGRAGGRPGRHQIRTPLATALLYASQMTLPDRTSTDLRRCGEKTIDSLKQLDRLVKRHALFRSGRSGTRAGERERAARAGGRSGCVPPCAVEFA